MRQLILPALLLIAFLCSTRLPAMQPTAEDGAFFEKKVRPILAEHCQRCHSHQAKKLKGSLALDSRVAILHGGSRGEAVVVGKPEQSLLIQAVRYQNPRLEMPPQGKLPAREIAILEEWVRRGVPFPGGESADRPAEKIDLASARSFWSFRPVETQTLPAVKEVSWPRGRIDRFLLAAMEQRGLAPAKAASRQVLIRRASFDLIGLPPTQQEVEAFVADSSPDAHANLIDRLLTSPRYGERWARFWLDLTRYCDVAESWAGIKGAPWLYRDWVVRALNEDMPYDRFVRMQLAADLMKDAVPADRAALGFLGLSPVYWKELKLAPDVIRTVVAEEWEERIEAVCGTYLGLTAACARCHDHKFDPITTRDYYALAGVFASIRQVDKRLLPAAEAAVAQKAHARVATLQTQIDALKKKKPVTEEIKKEIETLQGKIEAIRQSTPHFDAPLAAVVEEASLHVLADGPHRTRLEYKPGQPRDVPMHLRGNAATPGPVVKRRFFEVFADGKTRPFAQGSGRLELADAIVTEATPLAARVMVNRVWAHHFGRGLVVTPSDFGSQGARPSHPELLDDLAARFIAHGWSLRWLHREIMLSAAYQQASTHEPKKASVDPDNRLLARMSPRRLEIEAWRDTMLAVSGQLDLRQGGPPQDLGSSTNHRRTIYGIVKRRELNDILRLHDFPDPTAHTASRVPTTTPLQQLFVLNSPFIQQQADALARRLKVEAPGSIEKRVRHAYQLVYGRPVTKAQLALAVEFLTPESDALWTQYCQVLLGSNELLFVD